MSYANPSPEMRLALFLFAQMAGAEEEEPGRAWLLTNQAVAQGKPPVHAIVWDTGLEVQARCYPTAALARQAWPWREHLMNPDPITQATEA